MARVVYKTVDESEQVAFPRLDAVTASEGVKTRAVVTEQARPIHLWHHKIAAGAKIQWARPPVDHLVYVLGGNIEVENRRLGTGCAVIVEHNGATEISGGSLGAVVLHYHRPDNYHVKPSKLGGHVHLVESDGIFSATIPERHQTNTIWADSACPTCEIWLHRSQFEKSRPISEPHFHTDDEILFVLSGRMLVGSNTLTRGTALAIDANTTYAFGVDDGGVSFLNFQTSEPYVALMEQAGKPKHAPWKVRDNMMQKGAVMRGLE